MLVSWGASLGAGYQAFYLQLPQEQNWVKDTLLC